MIIENLNSYQVGDVIKLKFGTFITKPGKDLVDTNHRFVVVDPEGNICELSSNESKVSRKYPWNVPLLDWEDAGLLKPSHVKTDSSGIIKDDNVFELTAHLSQRDIDRVVTSYNKAPQNYLLEWISD